MKKIILSLLLFVCSILTNAFAQTATLDQTFGQNGRIVIPNTTEILFFDFDTHGNIIAVGYTIKSGIKYDLTIIKTDANGIIDTSFGSGGVVKVTDYDEIWPYGMKITNDNKIVVIGSFTKVQFQGYEIIIMRFNENGTVDESFGDHGKVNLNFNAGNIISLNLESDDFILIAKENQTKNLNPYIVKYSYDGEMKESFGENGMVYLTNSIYPFCMKILNDSSIVVAGTYNEWPNTELGLCKLTPAGVIDSDFANDGIWHLNTMQDFDLDYERFINIFEDQNQNLILSGYGLSSSQYCGKRSFLSKFSINGIWDTTFGENGFSCIDFSAITILQMNNKYLTVGWHKDRSYKITLINDDGSSANDIYTSKLFFHDMKFQGNNKIILGGTDKIDNTYDTHSALERVIIDLGASINLNDDFSKGLRIFPNPAKENLYFSDETTFEIIDIQGRVLLKSENPVKSISISNLNPGIYFVRLGSKVKKFVKVE